MPPDPIVIGYASVTHRPIATETGVTPEDVIRMEKAAIAQAVDAALRAERLRIQNILRGMTSREIKDALNTSKIALGTL